MSARAADAPRRRRSVGWVLALAFSIALGALGFGAMHAPVAHAQATNNFYLHHSASAGAITFVGSASNTEAAAATTLVITYSSTAGNLLVVMDTMRDTDNEAPQSVTDTAGNTWIKVTYENNCSGVFAEGWMWYAKNAAAVTSVTIHTNNNDLTAGYVLEFSGADANSPLDVFTSTCSSAGSTSPTSNAITPNFATDVVVALLQAPATISFSAGPTFTSGTTNNQALIESNAGAGGVMDLITGYDLPGGVTSQTYSGTLSASHPWSGIIAAFKTSGEYIDGTSPPGAVGSTFLMTAAAATRTWPTTVATAASQTVFSTDVFNFNYWTTGAGTANVTILFGYQNTGFNAGGSACNSIQTIASQTVTLTSGSNLTTANFSPGSNVNVQQNSFFCLKITVNSVTLGGLTLNYDASTTTTNVETSQTIFIPELALSLLGLGLVAPAAMKRLRRRSGRAAR